MPRCPNCNYPLVLLSHRMKYKCAKCSKLYPQKQIEIEEFKKYNKKQKEEDIEKYKQQQKQESSKLRQLRKHIKYLFNPPKTAREYSKEYYLKNRDKMLASNKIYCELNREKIYQQRKKVIESNREEYLEGRKGYYLTNKEYILNKTKEWKLRNIERINRNERIRGWRTEQNKLAVEMLKKWQEEVCIKEIWFSPPTFLLS